MVVGLNLGTLLLTALIGAAPVAPIAATDRDAVVATVGGEPIRAGEIERLAAKATRGKTLDAESLLFLRSRLLDQVIARRLMLAYARRNNESPTAEELDAERALLKSQLAARRRTIDDLLKTESIGQEELDRQLAWNVVWRKYVARYVTEERVAAYFAAHRRDFDGTQLVVSHILLRASPGESKAGDELLKRAEKIRREIDAREVTFPEAAKKYSAGPSGKDAGRLGTIGRHGPMDEPFSRAAFALEVGQVSPPIKTRFGVHLIRCDDIKPGGKKLGDVRKELEETLSAELLAKLAKSERQFSPVKYTGVVPHRDTDEHEPPAAK
jgi:parvulin-like peptidyl-prolyl isomerase